MAIASQGSILQSSLTNSTTSNRIGKPKDLRPWLNPLIKLPKILKVTLIAMVWAKKEETAMTRRTKSIHPESHWSRQMILSNLRRPPNRVRWHLLLPWQLRCSRSSTLSQPKRKIRNLTKGWVHIFKWSTNSLMYPLNRNAKMKLRIFTTSSKRRSVKTILYPKIIQETKNRRPK